MSLTQYQPDKAALHLSRETEVIHIPPQATRISFNGFPWYKCYVAHSNKTMHSIAK